MTRINELNQITSVQDNDLLLGFDVQNDETRTIEFGALVDSVESSLFGEDGFTDADIFAALGVTPEANTYFGFDKTGAVAQYRQQIFKVNEFSGTTPAQQISNILTAYAGYHIKLEGTWALGNERIATSVNNTTLDLSGAVLTTTGHIDAPVLSFTGADNLVEDGKIINLEATDPAAVQYNGAIWFFGGGNKAKRVKVYGSYYVAFVSSNLTGGQSADYNTFEDCYSEGVFNRGFYAYGNAIGTIFFRCRANGNKFATYTAAGGSGGLTAKTSYGFNVNRSITSFTLSKMMIVNCRAENFTAHGILVGGDDALVANCQIYNGVGTTYGLVAREITNARPTNITLSNVNINGVTTGFQIIQCDDVTMIGIQTTNTTSAAGQFFGVKNVTISACISEKGVSGDGEGLQWVDGPANGTVSARPNSNHTINGFISRDWGLGRVPFRFYGTTNRITGYGMMCEGAQYTLISEATTNRIYCEGDFKYNAAGSAPITSGATDVTFVARLTQ